jgi:hypothetical protein
MMFRFLGKKPQTCKAHLQSSKSALPSHRLALLTMSFKLLDRVDSLLALAANEIRDAIALEVDTDEYKLKQRLVATLGEKIAKLGESANTLSEEWEVDPEDLPTEFEDYEQYRDWEGSVHHSHSIERPVTISGKHESRNTPSRLPTRNPAKLPKAAMLFQRLLPLRGRMRMMPSQSENWNLRRDGY